MKHGILYSVMLILTLNLISFLNTYLRIIYSSFPLKRAKNTAKNNTWMTTGIRTSYKHISELYLASKDTHYPKLKRHYKLYCKVLSNVILEAKQNNYNKQIMRSTNKIKTAWEILKVESGRRINKYIISTYKK
jgi:hypothetical protein